VARGQLDREGQAVEPLADRLDHAELPFAGGKARHPAARPLEEELDGLRVDLRGRRSGHSGRSGKGERREQQDFLPVKPQGLAARGHHAQPGVEAEQLLEKAGDAR
jgi:hypothetical protein